MSVDPDENELNDADLIEAARRGFEQPPSTDVHQRLEQARRNAVAAVSEGGPAAASGLIEHWFESRGSWAAGATLACVLALTVFVALPQVRSDSQPNDPNLSMPLSEVLLGDDTEVLVEDLELLEDLEFLAWLEGVSSNEQG